MALGFKITTLNQLGMKMPQKTLAVASPVWIYLFILFLFSLQEQGFKDCTM